MSKQIDIGADRPAVRSAAGRFQPVSKGAGRLPRPTPPAYVKLSQDLLIESKLFLSYTPAAGFPPAGEQRKTYHYPSPIVALPCLHLLLNGHDSLFQHPSIFSRSFPGLAAVSGNLDSMAPDIQFSQFFLRFTKFE